MPELHDLVAAGEVVHPLQRAGTHRFAFYMAEEPEDAEWTDEALEALVGQRAPLTPGEVVALGPPRVTVPDDPRILAAYRLDGGIEVEIQFS